MNNFENQFGLFDNNLENFDSDVKTAVSFALETEDSREKIDSGEPLSILFISDVINNIQKSTGDKYDKMIDYEEIIYPKIIKNVKGILDFLKIKHVFENDVIPEDREKKETRRVDYTKIKKIGNILSGSDAHERWEQKNEK